MMLLPWLIFAAVGHAEAPPACPIGAPTADAPATVYLITASPGANPFSFVGHSSLWVRDGASGINHVWEYGVINSRKQEPLSSLLLGTLLCSWQVRPVRREAGDYQRQERTAVAHPLRLSPARQARFQAALHEIGKHQDRDDLFHWRQNSCATKVRDLVAAELDGQVEDQLATPAPLSPRAEVLRHVGGVPWAWLGLNLAGGVPVDRPMSWWEAGFLPVRLLEGLQQVQVEGPAGQQSLVGAACTLNTGAHSWPPPAPPQRTGLLWAVGLVAGGVVGGLGRLAQRNRLARAAGGLFIAVIGMVVGILGSLLVAFWGTSALHDFRWNHITLLANPLTLALVPLGWAWARGQAPGWGRPVAGALAILGLPALVLSVLPVWPQAALDLVGLVWPTLIAAALWALWLGPVGHRGRPVAPPE